MLAYLFPGQGAQIKGMGATLFEQFSEHTAVADEILGYSIRSLCLDDPNQQLNLTAFTQPALYVVNALMYLKAIEDAPKPDYVAGHSLGEYNALFAAGVFDFATGLTLVKKRGELMGEARDGKMAAILGLSLTEVTQTLASHDLSTITIANYNTHQQFVISGPETDINHAQTIFTQCSNATFIPLNVSGAFHSPYMLSAQLAFTEFLDPIQFKTPQIPVISNIDATPYHPAVLKDYLIQQITEPVLWTAIIDYLLTKKGITLKEIGPGKVLSGLIRRIIKEKNPATIVG